MPKDYQCPACRNPIDGDALVCSNSECRKELAYCSHCRDITTYSFLEAGAGRFSRDKFRCVRCERIGVKCLTWKAGGYCNGLARTGSRWDQPLCARCMHRVGEMGRSVLGWTLAGALGGLIKRRK